MNSIKAFIKRYGWTCVLIAWILVIWGNSLVPGEGSGSLSLGVVQWVQNFLMQLHLPYEWITNFLIRKGAHFSEYAVLGILSCLAFKTEPGQVDRKLLYQLLLLACVPCIDETIQIFVPGRCGAITDVLIDMSGALFGFMLGCFIRLHHN